MRTRPARIVTPGPLRIGVDARELLGDATGVGRYLGELMRRWTTRPDKQNRQFILYSPEPITLTLARDAVEYRIGGRGRGTWWEQTWLRSAVIEDSPAVFFAPAYTAPLGIDVPFVLTIHDISFVAHPEWFRIREGARRRLLTGRAADAAAVVLTDSEFSRGEIERLLGVPGSRVQVIPPGVTHPVLPVDAAERHPLVLYVGSLFNRRHLPDLIAAFARATRHMAAARLVIVGGDRTWPRQDLPAIAAAHGVGARTEFLDYAHDDQLSALYARASVFGFLSEYEGFGLTPLEALASGVPPIVMDTPVAREVYGDAAVFVPPDDVHAAADAIEELLTSPEARRRLLARAPAVLSRYSWDAAATRTLDAIEEAARR